MNLFVDTNYFVEMSGSSWVKSVPLCMWGSIFRFCRFLPLDDARVWGSLKLQWELLRNIEKYVHKSNT